MSFQDHFSGHADAYARHRPTYPAELFAFLAAEAGTCRLAWDCGTGNGQAARGLAERFAFVVASDPSRRQLAQASPHPRIAYVCAAERGCGLRDARADLVAAAQAFHWFDADAFFSEAARVLRAGGLVAVWSYGFHTVAPDIDPVLTHFHTEVIGPDWPFDRSIVDRGYRDIVFPFPEISAPAFSIERAWTLDELGAYISTWSPVRRHAERTGRDPVPALMAALAVPWGNPGGRRIVRWPVGMRVGRVG